MLSKRKTITITLLAIVTIISGVLLVVLNSANVVYATDTKTISVENVVSKEVAATYTFVPINDTECNVKIANKDVATKAVLPVWTAINGKNYKVTEIALNGFMGASKLTYVGLSNSIKTIRNNAFANCAELSEINLSGVREIGNYAFMMCPKLKELIIPASATTINNAILRNNDTQVMFEVAQEAAGWSSTWNANNANQTPLYGCDANTALIYEPLFATINSEIPVAYAISGSRNIISSGVSKLANSDENDYEIVDNTIFIPATYSDGAPIIKIGMDSFSGITNTGTIDNLIIEYSSETLSIESSAFCGLPVDKIFINRKINFNGEYGDSDNIFAATDVTKIIMPNTIDIIPDAAFYECKELSGISFIAPQERSRDSAKKYLTDYIFSNEITLPENADFCIGENVFYKTTSINQINIPNTVTTVKSAAFEGWNDKQTIKVDKIKGEEGSNWDTNWAANCNAKIQFTGYKLIFNANGGYVSEETKDVYINKSIGELIEPTLSNANFAGWYTMENGVFEQRYTADTVFNCTDNVELFARWQCDIEYKIYSWSTKKLTYDLNETISLYDYYRAGFNGWYRNDNTGIKYSFGDIYGVKGNTSFTAEWEEKKLDECYGYSDTPYSGYWYSIYGPNQLRELRDKVNNNKFDPKLVRLMDNINLTDIDWIPFNEITFDIEGQGYTITYKNENVAGNSDFGFTLRLAVGMIRNVNFKAKIKTKYASPTSEKCYIGVVVANAQGGGIISNCNLISYIGSGSSYYNSITSNNTDILNMNSNAVIGGFVGLGYAKAIQFCKNDGLSIASCGSIGGIVGENHCTVNYCINEGEIYYDLNENGLERRYVGGIAAYQEDRFLIYSCENTANITFAKVTNGTVDNSPLIAQIVGVEESDYGTTSLDSNSCNGMVISTSISSSYTEFVVNGERAYYLNNRVPEESGGGNGGHCVAAGSLITLADGTQVAVEDLRGNELLLVWNLYTGTFDVAPILFIDTDVLALYKVINLSFSDGTTVKVITEHAFWDFDLNKYVFLREDAEKYLGHWFNKLSTNENGVLSWTKVQLISVKITEETTTAWSPVTFSHLCYYVNGMLSIPGATEGLINIFEVDNDAMKYNESAMASDIIQYGLYTYEEFAEIYPITEEVFNAFNGQYLKISIGKGLITLEEIGELINRYAELLS